MVREVVFRPSARADLRSIFDYVAEAAGATIAEAYQARIKRACYGLADFPDRGTPRDDLKKGLRTLAFERRAVIAYIVTREEVSILRILHGGRDLKRAF